MAIIIPDANGNALEVSTENGFVKVGDQTFDTEQIGWLISALEAASDAVKVEAENGRL